MAYKFNIGTFKVGGILDMGSATDVVHADGTVDNDDLAGSIADSKLNQITTADKVAGSAVELKANSAIEDSTGLALKSNIAGDGLAIAESGGNQVLSVDVDDSSIEINSDSLRVKALGVTNAMLAGSIANAKLANSTISGVALGGNLSALAVDDSSIEYSAGSAFNGSAASTIRVKALGITNAMLAGSIADGKLNQITNANKVAGSAIQLASNTGLEDDTGLALKAGIAGDGLAIAESGGNQVLSVDVDDSSIEINSDSLRVKATGITNAMLAGSIANAKLANSAITVGGSATSLGGTVTGAHIAAALNSDLGGDFTIGTEASDTATFSGNVVVATPTADSHAATKAYVDGVASGLDVKKSVRASSTGNIAGTYNNGAGTITAGSNGALGAQDGVTMLAGERLLLKNQTSPEQNGIYVVTAVGDGSNPYVLTRATDMDEAAEITPGLFTFIEEGSDFADQGFVLSTDGAITLGTTALNFTQFSGAGQITAGTGLSKSGNTISLDATHTAVTSILNASLVLGASANNKIDFSTSNKIEFFAQGNKHLTLEQNSFKFDRGSLHLKVREITTNAASSVLDAEAGQMIVAAPTGSGLVVQLPQISGASLAGLFYTIKNKDTTQTVAIATNGSEEIEGSASNLTLEPQAAINCFCDGVRWHVY